MYSTVDKTRLVDGVESTLNKTKNLICSNKKSGFYHHLQVSKTTRDVVPYIFLQSECRTCEWNGIPLTLWNAIAWESKRESQLTAQEGHGKRSHYFSVRSAQTQK